MPLAITCACGARLEIDDRFAGQVVPCPDCQAPLRLPAPPPVRHPRVSGPAITSLLVALVGAFTLVGAAAGIVLGRRARQRIERDERLTGLSYARAAQVVGVTGIVLTLAALLSPEVLQVDALWREFRWAKQLDYAPLAVVPPEVTRSVPGGDRAFTLEIPSRRWGVWQPKNPKEQSDHLILFDVRDDAQLAVQSVELNGDEQDNWEAARARGLDRFAKSELLSLLMRRQPPPPATPTPRDIKQRDDGSQEMLVDLRAGLDRTFLVRMVKKDRWLFVVVGAARKQRFARMEKEFKKAFNSFQVRTTS